MAATHQYPLDSRFEHRAIGAAALTASATIDTHNQRGKTRTDYVSVFTIGAIDIANSDEEYRFIIEVSNDSFSTVETAMILSLGDTAVRLGGGPDNVAGDRYDVPWCTEVNGTVYQSWRIRLEVAGTSPSITCSMFTTTP